MRLPEFRVTSRGVAVSKVEWDPKTDGAGVVDLTDMKVTQVKRVIDVEGFPVVQITFVGRLVEVEE